MIGRYTKDMSNFQRLSGIETHNRRAGLLIDGWRSISLQLDSVASVLALIYDTGGQIREANSNNNMLIARVAAQQYE